MANSILDMIFTAGKAAVKMTEYGTAAYNVAQRFRGIDEANQNLLLGLEKQLAVNQQLSNVYSNLAKPLFAIEQKYKQLNTVFGISSKTAASLGQQLLNQGQSLGIANSKMVQYASNIKRMLPTLNQFSTSMQNSANYTGLVQVNDVLIKQLGLTAQQAQEYSFYAAQRGENAKKELIIAKQVADAFDPGNKMGYFKMITEDIADAGADIQLYYGKLPGNLEVAALKGRMLGLTFDDMRKTTSNLLNIESSIGQELEYQLLSGRRLVGDEKSAVDLRGKSLTNAYREAALTRNSSKQANVLFQILKQEGAVLETNLLARQQMSELLGIDEKTLSRSIQKQRLLESIQGGEQLFELTGDKFINELKELQAAGKVTKETFEQLMANADTRTGDEILEEQVEIQEDIRFLQFAQVNALEALVQGTRDSGILNTKNLEAFGNKLLTVSAAGANLTGEIFKAFRTGKKATDYESTFGSEYTAPQSGLIETKTGGDTIIPSGYGDTIVYRPKDDLRIALNNEDNVSVVAGTKLYDQQNNTANAAPTIDLTQLANIIVTALNNSNNNVVSAINNQTQALKSDATFSAGLNNARYS